MKLNRRYGPPRLSLLACLILSNGLDSAVCGDEVVFTPFAAEEFAIE